MDFQHWVFVAVYYCDFIERNFSNLGIWFAGLDKRKNSGRKVNAPQQAGTFDSLQMKPNHFGLEY